MTDATGPSDLIASMASSGPTGPWSFAQDMLTAFPTAESGQTPAPLVIDITELLASQGGAKTQELNDYAIVSVLLNETRDTLRPAMFQWASDGFTAAYIIQSFTLTPPTVCSDGTSRNVYSYVEYLLKQDMATTISAIQALCVGVLISYSFSGNTLRIHVSKN